MQTIAYFSIISVLLVTICGNKYSKDANIPKRRDSKDVFRTKRLNVLWPKISKRLENDEMVRKRVHIDLIEIDHELLNAKHAKEEGKDPENQLMNLAEKKLVEVLTRFKLDDILTAFQGNKVMHDLDYANEKMRNSVTNGDKNVDTFFKDKKLHILWEEALKAGYTIEELLALKHEFVELDSKMNEFGEGIKKEEHRDGNSVHEKLNEDTIGEKDNLKKLDRLIYKDLKDLSDKIDQKSLDEDDLKTAKAQNLWNKALDGNFSTQQLADLKIELKHFESRLAKLEFIKQQADLNIQKLNKQGKAHLKEMETVESERKLKDFSHKVEKLEKYLSSKVHMEL